MEVKISGIMMSNSGGRFYVKQKNVPDGICKKLIHYVIPHRVHSENGGWGGMNAENKLGGGGGANE